jgi:hypothetical protein
VGDARARLQTMGPVEHDQTYQRIEAVAWRYNVVVNYGGTGMVLVYPRHLALSSSSVSTTHLYQSPATFLRPHAAFSAPTTLAQRPFAVHGLGIFTSVLLNFYT